MLWGGAFNSENFRAGFEAVSHRHREAALALGFGPLATFLNVTLPIGGRIALPSSINTYISVVKNTSLMYVIGYPELTTTAINISNLTLRRLEALTVLGIVYLTLVWTLSAVDPPCSSAGSRFRRRARCPTGRGRSGTTSSTRGCRTRSASPRSRWSAARSSASCSARC